MSDVYIALFILFCISCIGWGLEKMSRIYQFPFFMGGIFISFILPQAISLYITPKLPTQTALERVLLMATLCVLMCLFSYELPVSPKISRAFIIHVDQRKIFYGGLFLAALGFVSSIFALNTEATANSMGQLTGLRTIYSTFTYLSIPGFSILFLIALKQPSYPHIVGVLFAAFIPLFRIIMYGRRETTAAFALAIGLGLFFHKRLTPPRWLVISAILLSLLAIPMISEYRRISATGEWNQLLELKPIESLQNMVGDAKDLELEYGALQMDAAVKTGKYGYGIDYWNSLVFRFVPAQFLGSNFKTGLMLGVDDFSLLGGRQYNLAAFYGYKPNPGIPQTGLSDSFAQFNYFGCLFFLMLGYVFKNLWVSAVRYGSILAQVLYISFIPAALKGVTHATATCLADLIFCSVFIMGVMLYARRYVTSVSLRYDW